jgi:GTP diphosphokinase / guanosine-3',5'-bis(diphosphate) 3'-diphosphatase
MTGALETTWQGYGGEALLLLHGYPDLNQRLGYLSAGAREKIEKAYRFGAHAHREQFRKSGEAYITHPVAVAIILADLKMDSSSLLAGLLHDTVEDTEVSLEDVEREFGATVRRIVEGETKVSKLSKQAKDQLEDEQAENLRQLLVQMTKDIRIIIVKLADRLHNMRTLASMKPEKQVRIAKETLEIYAPLAHRLGIGSLKWELEDLSFLYLRPQNYAELAAEIRQAQAERDRVVQSAIHDLREMLQTDRELNRLVMRFEITGRSKHLYSIWGKMQRDTKSLEQIFDLLAIRVILEPRAILEAELSGEGSREALEAQREKRVCYHTLGVVHSLYTPIPGRFKDYIAVPKPNGYQSLHSTVISLEGQPIEVQIRTTRMHQIAEFGVAAHWLYKQGIEDGSGFESRSAGLDELRKNMNWLENLEALSSEIKDAGDFVDAVQQDLLSTRIFVFTPKGKSISLPLGATPIDLAYHIHTDIGHHAIGAKVNGSIVPLSYKLDNGERVEIIVNRGSPGPSRDWMDFAATRSAKSKIRQFFRMRERGEALIQGHGSLDRYLKKRGLPARKLMRTKNLEDISEKLLGSRNPDDLYMALHTGRYTPQQVARALMPELEPAQALPQPHSAPAPNPEGVFLEGGTGYPIKFAQCCKPNKGDPIWGYITRGRGVTIHTFSCSNAKRLREDTGRTMNAAWEASSLPSSNLVDFEVLAPDRVGLLKDILDVLEKLEKSALKVEANVANGQARIGLRLEERYQGEFELAKAAFLEVRGVRDVVRS